MWLTQQLRRKVFGTTATDLPVEQALLQFVLLAGLMLSLFGVFLSNFFHESYWVTSVILGCSLAVVYGIYLVRHNRHLSFVKGGMIAMWICIVPFLWFMNGGIRGSLILYVPVCTALSMLLAPFRQHLLILFLVLTEVVVLFSVEHAFPNWVVRTSDEFATLDLVLNTVVTSVILALLVHYVRLRYNLEQAKLSKTNDSLLKAQDVLTEAMQQAHAATEAKSLFLANVSHEIRTPLNGIIGAVELLQRTDLTVEQQSFLEVMQSSSHHLLSVINDVLDISKIEAGHVQLELAECSLRQLLKEVVDMTMPQLQKESKALRLTVKVDPQLPERILADAHRLRQVMVNLVGNAVKFTKEGEVTIYAKLQSRDGQWVRLLVEVADTGIGMEEEAMSRLFQPFSQLDNRSTRNYGGTGLGLSISKKLVEMMDGSIWASSRFGHGSVFSFELKLQAVDTLTSSPKPALAAATTASEGLRVLVAEDNSINQFVIRNVLRQLGVQPTIVENGLEALEACSTKSFDLVLMDMQMPVMDGVESAQQILQLPGRHKPMIVAMTANATKEDADKCYAVGMKEFISKPFTIEQIEQLLQRAQPADILV